MDVSDVDMAAAHVAIKPKEAFCFYWAKPAQIAQAQQYANRSRVDLGGDIDDYLAQAESRDTANEKATVERLKLRLAAIRNDIKAVDATKESVTPAPPRSPSSGKS